MNKRLKVSQISSMIKRLGLKQEDIIITDPKAEILSGMAQMVNAYVTDILWYNRSFQQSNDICNCKQNSTDYHVHCNVRHLAYIYHFSGVGLVFDSV